MRRPLITIVTALGCGLLLLLPAGRPVLAQQGQVMIHLYDEKGRLHVTLSALGEAAVYEYDAAGNLRAVRRLTPDDLEILSFTPRLGPVGTAVTIYGTGFNQGVSEVSFNGAPAAILRADSVSAVAVVPQGATTGLIRVVTPRGAALSRSPFLVRGVLLTPQAVTVPALDSVQFELTVSGTPTGNVLWSVNGIAGGDPSVGTVTAQGLYTAPNPTGTNPLTFSVRATSTDDPTLFGQAFVTVVPFGAGYQFLSGAISVRHGEPPGRAPASVGGAVSVRHGTPPNRPPTFAGGAVSVRYATPPNRPPAEFGGAVSAGRGPVLTSLSPGSVARGASFTLTANGIALGGAARVSFVRLANGAPESGITVSNISVNGQGTSLTATVSVPAGVAAGRYVVVVTTPAGATARRDVGSNALQVN